MSRMVSGRTNPVWITYSHCDLLRIRKCKNEETFCLFVDFQKAFKYVNNDLFFHKLLNIGICGKAYNTIKAIYGKPQSCVLANYRLSDWFTAQAGSQPKQVMHHRNHQCPRCQKELVLCNAIMKYIPNYKYLWCWVNEHGNDFKTVEALTASARRSYGRIVDIFRKLGDMGHRSFISLYESYVLPVANYAAMVWGLPST